jgi:uncharacterized protein YqgC (DUF456 family)
MSLPLIFAIVLLIPGLVLAFIPVVPAILYMFAVSLGYGILTHFTRLSGWEIFILGVITALSIVVDHLAGILGARWGGAGRRAMAFGLLGAVIGGVTGGPLMSFAGLFTGIFVTEVFQLRPHLEAFRAASGGVIGALIGFGINILISFLFFITFVILTVH